jgi:uncharacterized protein (TIGR04255 family)
MTPIRFSRPPVVEVVCGVTFDTQMLTMKTAHIGQLWERFRGEFPNIEDAPPVDASVEAFGQPTAVVSSVELLNMPPLRRAWFLDADGRHLIQVQADRFLFNWKRLTDSDEYPSYDAVIARFDRVLATFASFVTGLGIGELSFRQYELSYVNHIDAEHGLGAVGESDMFVDQSRGRSRDRFLPEPEAFNWKTTYLLPNNSGRLHVTARTALRTTDRQRLVRLDMMARGIPEDNSENARRPWFDQAHDWITHGFADITVQALHEIWGRTS